MFKPVLSIEKVKNEDEAVVFKLTGELSSFTLDKAREVLFKEVNSDIALDMRDLTYIDSSGIGFLILLSEKLRDNGYKLRILYPSPNLQNLFKLIHLGKIVEIII